MVSNMLSVTMVIIWNKRFNFENNMGKNEE